jgi:polysaccharide biosynthesis protein PslG
MLSKRLWIVSATVGLLIVVVAAVLLRHEKSSRKHVSIGVLSDPRWFGFNDDWRQMSDQVGLSAALGANTNRIPVYWSTIEPSPGRFMWKTTGYDRVYRVMVEAGQRPLLAVQSAPAWASGYSDSECPVADCGFPPRRRAYAAWRVFLEKLVRRYPRSLGIEIWNEPNLDNYWAPSPAAGAYVELLKISYRAVKSVSLRMPVVIAGMSPVPTSKGHVSTERFLEEILAKGASRYANAIGVHLYPRSTSGQGLANQLDMAQTPRAKYHARRLPLWITEAGYTTTGATKLSESDQAQGIDQLFAAAREDAIPVLMVHRLVGLGVPADSTEAGFGVYTPSLKPKPAAAAIARMRGVAYPGSH